MLVFSVYESTMMCLMMLASLMFSLLVCFMTDSSVLCVYDVVCGVKKRKLFRKWRELFVVCCLLRHFCDISATAGWAEKGKGIIRFSAHHSPSLQVLCT